MPFLRAGHFLLTNLLLPKLKETGKDCGQESRIVIVSSSLHKKPYPKVGNPCTADRESMGKCVPSLSHSTVSAGFEQQGPLSARKKRR